MQFTTHEPSSWSALPIRRCSSRPTTSTAVASSATPSGSPGTCGIVITEPAGNRRAGVPGSPLDGATRLAGQMRGGGGWKGGRPARLLACAAAATRMIWSCWAAIKSLMRPRLVDELGPFAGCLAEGDGPLSAGSNRVMRGGNWNNNAVLLPLALIATTTRRRTVTTTTAFGWCVVVVGGSGGPIVSHVFARCRVCTANCAAGTPDQCQEDDTVRILRTRPYRPPARSTTTVAPCDHGRRGQSRCGGRGPVAFGRPPPPAIFSPGTKAEGRGHADEDLR